MPQLTNPFEPLWPEMSEIYLQSGVVSLIDHIGSKSEPMQRRGLFLMASQRISAGQNLSRSLSDLIAISRAAIDEFATQAESETDRDERARRLDGANILSYNLSADLAPCWPEDPEPRTVDHYQEGIRCAEDCLRWRSELNKGAVPFHMAWWALGTHRCGLADWSAAVEAFGKSLEAAQDNARESATPVEGGPDASFLINISTGWLEFARWRGGDKTSYDRFLKVIDAFSQIARRNDDDHADSMLGIQQLETAASRLPTSSAPCQ
ncbi:MAG: hypothetical protein OSB09_00555 [Planctomycetota bacterium]|nr:hypothetical protein [Planctomycetota bacterium]